MSDFVKCPLTVTKCQRSDFTGRVNEIAYVAYEVPVHGVMVRTLACGRTFKKRPETHVPKPWWVEPDTIDDAMTSRWWTKPESYGRQLDESHRFLGTVPRADVNLLHDSVFLTIEEKDVEQVKKAWSDALSADERVKPTADNPHGNPPVTCEHCRKDIRWPDRDSCESCGGFTCGCDCRE